MILNIFIFKIKMFRLKKLQTFCQEDLHGEQQNKEQEWYLMHWICSVFPGSSPPEKITVQK